MEVAVVSSGIIVKPGLDFKSLVLAKETYGALEYLYLISRTSLETPCTLEVYIMKNATKKNVFIEFRGNVLIFYVTFFTDTISHLIGILSVTTM
jgi:hypothetical protein